VTRFYYINEMQFSDDLMLQKLSADEKQRALSYATIETPQRTDVGWVVTRNIHLGENVPDYKPCPVAE